jgi:rfaE bifunctional protein kinase chain/domain
MILDEYIYGRTGRISREAPVIIVHYDGSSYKAGGAANAAMNVAGLGGKAIPVGITGRDEPGRVLRETLKEAGIRAGGLIAVPGRSTTAKTRVLAGDYHAQRQQIVRIDREEREGLTRAVLRKLSERVSGAVRTCDAVILSDYSQGVLIPEIIGPTVERARKAGIPVVADSRYRLGEFKGVTTATPNEVEAADAAGIDGVSDDALERTGRKLLRSLRSDSLIVTRGRFGMSLFRPGRKTLEIGVVGSPEATDVTGAGDTVVAAVTLSLAAGADIETAMRIANIAASIVVMKRGTAVATPPEIYKTVDTAEKNKQGDDI